MYDIKLSVCITAYNRAKGLDSTLESLSHQTRLPDELIVSDDCSPYSASDIVEKWRNKFPSLIFNRNQTNLNMPGNLNVAINLTNGEYIANLHDADTFDPTMLEKWEMALDNHPTAGFVFSGLRNWPILSKSDNGIILHNVDPITEGRIFFENNFLHKFPSIVWGTVMARRSAYQNLLPFDPEFGFISDVDMWMRMCLNNDVAYVREPLICLDNSPSAFRTFNWDRLAKLEKMQKVNIRRFYEDNPHRIKREMRIHHRISRREYLRRIAGRIWHKDLQSFTKGVKLLSKL
jgi:glycosyltransferase involved in cell wall biosynthesis